MPESRYAEEFTRVLERRNAEMESAFLLGARTVAEIALTANGDFPCYLCGSANEIALGDLLYTNSVEEIARIMGRQAGAREIVTVYLTFIQEGNEIRRRIWVCGTCADGIVAQMAEMPATQTTACTICNIPIGIPGSYGYSGIPSVFHSRHYLDGRRIGRAQVIGVLLDRNGATFTADVIPAFNAPYGGYSDYRCAAHVTVARCADCQTDIDGATATVCDNHGDRYCAACIADNHATCRGWRSFAPRHTLEANLEHYANGGAISGRLIRSTRTIGVEIEFGAVSRGVTAIETAERALSPRRGLISDIGTDGSVQVSRENFEMRALPLAGRDAEMLAEMLASHGMQNGMRHGLTAGVHMHIGTSREDSARIYSALSAMQNVWIRLSDDARWAGRGCYGDYYSKVIGNRQVLQSVEYVERYATCDITQLRGDVGGAFERYMTVNATSFGAYKSTIEIRAFSSDIAYDKSRMIGAMAIATATADYAATDSGWRAIADAVIACGGTIDGEHLTAILDAMIAGGFLSADAVMPIAEMLVTDGAVSGILNTDDDNETAEYECSDCECECSDCVCYSEYCSDCECGCEHDNASRNSWGGYECDDCGSAVSV